MSSECPGLHTHLCPAWSPHLAMDTTAFGQHLAKDTGSAHASNRVARFLLFGQTGIRTQDSSLGKAGALRSGQSSCPSCPDSEGVL